MIKRKIKIKDGSVCDLFIDRETIIKIINSYPSPRPKQITETWIRLNDYKLETANLQGNLVLNLLTNSFIYHLPQGKIKLENLTPEEINWLHHTYQDLFQALNSNSEQKIKDLILAHRIWRDKMKGKGRIRITHPIKSVNYQYVLLGKIPKNIKLEEKLKLDIWLNTLMVLYQTANGWSARAEWAEWSWYLKHRSEFKLHDVTIAEAISFFQLPVIIEDYEQGHQAIDIFCQHKTWCESNGGQGVSWFDLVYNPPATKIKHDEIDKSIG